MEGIACSLSAGDRTARSERWRRLDVADRIQTAGGLTLVFRRGPGVEAELEALVALERECCAFATWSVRGDAEHVVLEIGASGESIPAVHAMFS